MTPLFLFFALLAMQAPAGKEVGTLSGQGRNIDNSLLPGVRVAVIAVEGDGTAPASDAPWSNIAETDTNGR
jgi:hypothetical protein